VFCLTVLWKSSSWAATRDGKLYGTAVTGFMPAGNLSSLNHPPPVVNDNQSRPDSSRYVYANLARRIDFTLHAQHRAQGDIWLVYRRYEAAHSSVQ